MRSQVIAILFVSLDGNPMSQDSLVKWLASCLGYQVLFLLLNPEAWSLMWCPIQWMLEALSSDAKSAGVWADHSPPYHAKEPYLNTFLGWCLGTGATLPLPC